MRTYPEYHYSCAPDSQSFHSTVYGPAPVIGDNNQFSWTYVPVNYVQPPYPAPYYQAPPNIAYTQPICAPPVYQNMTVAQDPSVLFYSCSPPPGNGVHPVTLHPQYMGMQEYQPAMYPTSVPTHQYSQPIPALIPPVPQLEDRRNSCSSADSVAAPQTPSLSSTCVESVPSIAGECHRGIAFSPPEKYRPATTNFSNHKVSSHLKLNNPGYTRNSLYNPSKTTNVYVRGLAPETNDDKLYLLIRSFGNVVQHKAIVEKETGFCKGYGFARFETIDEAKACIIGMAKYNLDAGFARESFNSRLKSLGDPNSTNLYVSNLSPNVDEDRMREIFAEYPISSVRILRTANGESRGVGFVRLANHDACNKVIAQFDNTVVNEGEPPIQVRYADTHAQKNLKESTARVREFYCNEQKKVLAGVPTAPGRVPTGPRHDGTSNRRWIDGLRESASKPAYGRSDDGQNLDTNANADHDCDNVSVITAVPVNFGDERGAA